MRLEDAARRLLLRLHVLRLYERLLLIEAVVGAWAPAGSGTRRAARAMQLEFKRLAPHVALPSYAHPGDAGLDLASAIDAEIGPGERILVPTGLAVAIPDGYAGLVLPRSGLASRQGLTLVNSPGLIDAGYRGEITCAMVNLDRASAGRINAGDRIAQLVVVAIPQLEPIWADELPRSERGERGFGSTGQ